MFAKIRELYLLRARAVLAVLWIGFLISLLFDPLTLSSHAENTVAWDIRLFWTLISLSPVFLLVFGHEAWRRICPLSFLSQVPKYLGQQKPDIFPKESWIAKNHLFIQFFLLATGVWARAVFLNSDRLLLAIFLTLIILSAMFVGWRYSGKPWCHYFCPMSTVQKFFSAPSGILESTPHRAPTPIPKSMCRIPMVNADDERSCVSCRSHCPDIDLEQNYWRELDKSGQSLVYFGYPGILLGFYWFQTYRNNGISNVINGSWTTQSVWQHTTNSDIVLALGCFSVAIGLTVLALSVVAKEWAKYRQKVGIAYSQALHEVYSSTVLCSFLSFYYFGQGSFKWLVPSAFIPVFLFVITGVALLWFSRTIHRSPNQYQQELITLKLRKQLDRLYRSGSEILRKILGKKKLVDLQENEIYWVGKTLNAYSAENSSMLYQSLLKPLLKENASAEVLFSSLASMRAALGVRDEDHHLILRKMQEGTGIKNGERIPLEDTLKTALYQKAIKTFPDLSAENLLELSIKLNIPIDNNSNLPSIKLPQLTVGKVIDLSISDGRKNAKYRARIEQISGHDIWVELSLNEASLPFKAGALVSGYCIDEHLDCAYRFLSRIKRKHLDKAQRILIQTPTELARTERRVFMRAALSFKATLTPLAADGLEDASIVADCLDVSAGGALFSVSSHYHFSLAQTVQLDFTLPDGRQMSSTAAVVRLDSLVSVDQRLFSRIAVLFVDMHDADQEHLSKIVFQYWSGLFIDKQQFGALTWKNTRLFRVDATVDEGGYVKSFYLKPHDGRRLPLFKSGQFLTFQLAIGQQQKIIRRCYSLSDSPRADYFRVSIKRAAAPKDQPLLPSGLSSSFFHDYVSAGTLLEVMQPAGSFYLDDKDMRAIVLIGGGIGITPVLSMLNHLTLGGFPQPIYLFLGFRNQAEHVFKTHLEAITAEYPQVQLIVCYSNPALNDQQGKDYQVKGYVTAELIANTIASLDSHFYLCGPPVFMKSITEGLIQAGAQTADVRFEAFGPASVTSCNHPELPVKKDAKITFVNAEQTYTWSDKPKTILELAELNGISLPYGCRAGNCHACAIEIQSGEVLYLKNPEPPPEFGACLTCIAVPKMDLVLVDPH